MLERSGYEVVDAPNGKDAISGGGQVGPEDYLDVAKKVGAIRTFCKPIDRKELLATVREILS